MIILDTNVLSELPLPNPDTTVSLWFSAQAEADLAIASYSIAEIEYGIATAPRSLAAQLTAWLAAILATQRIAPLDAAHARILGRLHAVPGSTCHMCISHSRRIHTSSGFGRRLERIGTAGNLTIDAHLAVLAMERGYVLYSSDADFARFKGLHWVNPCK